MRKGRLVLKVRNSLARLFKASESGQTLVEYSLIIALIVIAAIVGLTLVASQTTDSLWGGIVEDVGDAVESALSSR